MIASTESRWDRNRTLMPMAMLVVFVCGAVLGGGLVGWMALLRTGSPNIATPQRAEVVLVVQTATPMPSAIESPAIAAPSPDAMPAAETAATLAGAPDYARVGEADASVQLVVFADPQCPYCKQHALETLAPLIETYVKTGKAALTYRHFTFLGEESRRIAAAMVCAGGQGREAFWAFHDLAFKNQFAENSGQATAEAMLAWAQTAQIDIARFKLCANSDDAKQQVEADTMLGRKLRVTGTPTLFINGRPIPGAVSFEFVRGIVDEALAKNQ